jgi:hypothetical protein
MVINIPISTSSIFNTPAENALECDAQYTGNAGLYASVKLTTESRASLNELCKAAQFGDLTDEAHCTVMYSSDKAIPLGKACDYSLPAYKATATKFTWWAGHDNAGYLTLQIGSDSLQDEHARLKKFGCKHSFDDYKPHVTIQTPIAKISNGKLRYGNMILKRQPLELVFDNQSIEDCDQ